MTNFLVPIPCILLCGLILHCANRKSNLIVYSESIPTTNNGIVTKRLYVIRHAEGYHNVAGNKNPLAYLREDLQDAELTDFGKSQCESVAQNALKIVNGASLLVVSPMQRTLQTATICFPQLVDKIPWIALENIRERTGLHPCDRRRSISFYSNGFDHVNFKLIDSEEDPIYYKHNLFREPKSSALKRGLEFMKWIKSRPEQEIIVVSHSNYLKNLFNDVVISEEKNIYFQNCELKTFDVTFQDDKILAVCVVDKSYKPDLTNADV